VTVVGALQLLVDDNCSWVLHASARTTNRTKSRCHVTPNPVNGSQQQTLGLSQYSFFETTPACNNPACSLYCPRSFVCVAGFPLCREQVNALNNGNAICCTLCAAINNLSKRRRASRTLWWICDRSGHAIVFLLKEKKYSSFWKIVCDPSKSKRLNVSAIL